MNTPFTWTAGSESLRSIIEISEDPLFASDVLADTVESPTTSVKLPAGLTKYHWRARADNGGALGDWSETFVLTTGVAAPPLLEPANGATNTSVEPTLRWEALAVEGSTYRLQVATSSVFQASQMVLNIGGLETPSHVVTGLGANKKYFWRINATVDGDSSVFSKPYTFTTGASTGVDEGEVTEVIELAPSPVLDVLTVKIRPLSGADARISIVDLQGNVVTEIRNSINSETESSVHISCANLIPGLYAVRCVSGEAVTQRVFVKY